MRIPIFPLHLVLFPGETTRLHIFEPRYQQMLKDAMAGNKSFGVVLIRSGREAGEPAEPHSVGTVATITEVQPLPDGRSDIIIMGVRRFRITRLYADLPYLKADYELLDDSLDPNEVDDETIRGLNEGFRGYMRLFGGEAAARAETIVLPEEPARLGNLISAAIQVSLAEKQRLLEQAPAGRLQLLVNVLAREAIIAAKIGPSVAAVKPWLKQPSIN